MSLTAILAVVAIVIGIVVAAVDGEFLFPPLVWFVLAIALNTLKLDYSFGRRP